MKVYVVSEECDAEYFCTRVLFITSNKQTAIDYCKKHNKHYTAWNGCEIDTVTYKAYKVKE